MYEIIVASTATCALLLYLIKKILTLKTLLQKSKEEYQKLLSQKKSSEIRLGQISEHIAPFINTFPFDSKKARFLGTPIDMIVFERDKIVIVEIKSGESKLTDTQKQIKQLVEEKKIEWYTHRID
jgi:predicted Holliday junction resolvase-like endonuclease